MAKAQSITGLNPTAPTSHNARLILRQRLKEMYAFAPYIDNPDNISELHNLRIAAKRVRYTLEVFEEFLPAAAGNFARELATLQDELGNLHDSEVMLSLLRQLLQQADPGASPGEGIATPTPSPQAVPLPNGIAETLLRTGDAATLSARERRGLGIFLQHQEQRRVRAYAAFRQHWESMEQKHFRATLLALLNENKEKEGQHSF